MENSVLQDHLGTGMTLDDPEIMEMDTRNFASTDAHIMARNIEMLSKLVEKVHITSHENNGILFQLLNGYEERTNRRIEDLRREMIGYIDQKFENFTAMQLQMQQMNNSRQNSDARSVVTSSALPPKGKLPQSAPTGIIDTAAGHSNASSRRPSGTLTQGDVPSVPMEVVTITPYPGFVIKTRKIMGLKEKVFINIFHHESIALEPPNAARTIMADSKPFLVMGETTSALDKDGHNCYTFNIGVSSDYFKLSEGSSEGEPLEIASPASVVKIIHKINLKFTEFLDENQYSLPRLALGYKGDFIPPFTIPVPAKTGAASAGNGGSGGLSAAQLLALPSNTTTGTAAGAPLRTMSRNSYASSEDNDVASVSTFDNLPSGGKQQQMNAKRPSFTSLSSTNSNNNSSNNLRKVQRKSFFGDMNSTASHLLNASMLEYIREECLDANSCRQLKQESVNDPHILLGWQIALLDEEGKMITDIYVVTDVRKNMMSQTEYRLSKQDSDDLWLRLKRRGEAGSDKDDDKAKAKTNSKGQHDFRPLRKVLTIFDKVPAQPPSGGLQLIEESEESNRSIDN